MDLDHVAGEAQLQPAQRHAEAWSCENNRWSDADPKWQVSKGT